MANVIFFIFDFTNLTISAFYFGVTLQQITEAHLITIRRKSVFLSSSFKITAKLSPSTIRPNFFMFLFLPNVNYASSASIEPELTYYKCDTIYFNNNDI